MTKQRKKEREKVRERRMKTERKRDEGRVCMLCDSCQCLITYEDRCYVKHIVPLVFLSDGRTHMHACGAAGGISNIGGYQGCKMSKCFFPPDMRPLTKI